MSQSFEEAEDDPEFRSLSDCVWYWTSQIPIGAWGKGTG